MVRSLFSAALVVFGFSAASGSALAQKFKPFTEVKNVCPDCPQIGYDRVVLKSGESLHVRILAENPQFHVLERHGELRAVGNDQIKVVERNPDIEREKDHDDQILLKSGHVLSGKITRERADTGMYEMKRAKFAAQFAYKSQIEVVFKGGKKVFPSK